MKIRSVKANFIFNITKTLMTILFPVISFPYASRVLGVSAIGRVQGATSIISYFAMFAALGISLYAVREGAKVRQDREKLSKLSKELIVINLISTFLVYLVLFVCIGLGFFDGRVSLILVCSLLIVFTTFSIEWLYQIVEDYAYISIRSIILQLLSLLLLFGFVKGKDDYIMYAFVTVFSNCGFFFFNFIHSKKYISLFKNYNLDLKQHIKPILIIFGVGAASSIYLNLDVIFIEYIHGEYEVGLYTAATKINVIVKTLIASVSVVVIPRLSSYLHNKQYDLYNQLLKSGINLNLIISIPCAVGLFLLSKDVIYIFSGEAYLEAVDASKILAINMIFSAIDGLLYYQVLVPHNKEKQACIGTVVGSICNMILNALLIPTYGIEGASFATLISEIFVFIFFLYFLREVINIRFMFKDVYKYLLSIIPIVIIVVTLKIFISNLVVYIILATGLSAIAYFICLLLLKVDLAHELMADLLKILKIKRNV